MGSSFLEIKRKNLKRRLAEQVEEYEAVNAQLGRVLDELSRIRLERQAAHITGEIGRIEAELAGLGPSLGNYDAVAVATHPTDRSNAPSDQVLLRLQLLHPGENKLVVRGVTVPSGGQPKSVVSLPYSLIQLSAILKALDVGFYDQKRFKPEYTQALAELNLLNENRLHPNYHAFVGQMLYQTLFAGEIGNELEQARRTKKPLACQLEFDPEDVVLAQFPWELIHDAATFCIPLKGGIELSRSIAFAVPPPPLTLKTPLRILLVSPRPRGEDEIVNQSNAVQAGLAALAAAGQVSYRTLTPPTWAAFEEALYQETFDIIHFDGHGSFARHCPACGTPHYPSQQTCADCKADMSQATPQGYLHFEDAVGQVDRANVTDMQVVLANSEVQLLFLSACGSGVVQGVSVFNGIAPALIRIGIPAVVAMQASPPDGSSTVFVQRFYDGLAKGERLVAAVGNGRRAIFRPQQGEPISWFMPVVYLRHNNTD